MIQRFDTKTNNERYVCYSSGLNHRMRCSDVSFKFYIRDTLEEINQESEGKKGDDAVLTL